MWSVVCMTPTVSSHRSSCSRRGGPRFRLMTHFVSSPRVTKLMTGSCPTSLLTMAEGSCRLKARGYIGIKDDRAHGSSYAISARRAA